MLRDKKCILLVEDDRVVLATLALGLQRAGYRILTADCGHEALAMIAGEARPDLAIFDIRLPDMCGLDVAAAAREKAIPFVVLSAYSEAELIARASEAGALGFLVKPLEVAQIIPTVETVLCRAHELGASTEQNRRLEEALETSRIAATAVGILMERQRLSRNASFEMLRRTARSRRSRVEDVARELIQAVETLSPPGGDAAAS